jgi:outer membrane lipoprotein-sorting protein
LDYLDTRSTSETVAETVAFDGTTLSVVDHASHQLVQTQHPDSALAAAVSFLTDSNALATEFTAAIDSMNHDSTVLVLTPTRPSAPTRGLRLVVDASDWHVTEVSVLGWSGDTTDVRFERLDLTSPVRSSWFEVNPRAVPSYAWIVDGAARR